MSKAVITFGDNGSREVTIESLEGGECVNGYQVDRAYQLLGKAIRVKKAEYRKRASAARLAKPAAAQESVVEPTKKPAPQTKPSVKKEVTKKDIKATVKK